jgi:hypothetical protein
LKPIEVNEVEMAFPAEIEHLIPPLEDIPSVYKDSNPWEAVFKEFFYNGNKNNIGLIPKEDIDPSLAFRHISCVIRTYSIKHEYKTAACCYLFDTFFIDALLNFEHKPGKYKSLITQELVEIV